MCLGTKDFVWKKNKIKARFCFWALAELFLINFSSLSSHFSFFFCLFSPDLIKYRTRRTQWRKTASARSPTDWCRWRGTRCTQISLWRSANHRRGLSRAREREREIRRGGPGSLWKREEKLRRRELTGWKPRCISLISGQVWEWQWEGKAQSTLRSLYPSLSFSHPLFFLSFQTFLYAVPGLFLLRVFQAATGFARLLLFKDGGPKSSNITSFGDLFVWLEGVQRVEDAQQQPLCDGFIWNWNTGPCIKQDFPGLFA